MKRNLRLALVLSMGLGLMGMGGLDFNEKGDRCGRESA